MNKQILITKSTGEIEPFDIFKLKMSLTKAGATPETTHKILSKIEQELFEGITTKQIYKKAFTILNKEEKKIATTYSIRKAVLELGPNGFPFEDFVGEIFRAKGYKVNVGETINGKCVMHEIDVVAENESEVITAELKFHNGITIKSDLKVALYVKARFDDLEAGGFYQSKPNKKHRKLLVTNTKFSSQAIQYANCAGLEIISWNYPPGKDLQRLIEETELHPLTCLTTLGKKEMQDLLNQGIVLCKELRNNGGEEILKSVGLNREKISKILNEVEKIYNHTK